MVNFTQIKIKKLSAIFTILLSCLLLQACGGQRDEPFNASTSSSSASSIEATYLISGNTPMAIDDYTFKRREVSEDEFKSLWRLYTNQDVTESILSKTDFTKGQVVLIDLGRTTICDPKSALDRFAVYQKDTGKLRVILTYKRSDGVIASSSTSSSSSSNASSVNSSSSSSASSVSVTECGNASYVQNYYFYYIKSLDQIFYDETGK